MYYQTITQLNPTNFKPLPSDRQKAFEQLDENLWSMFNLRYDDETRIKLLEEGSTEIGLRVNDYAWTKEVKGAFENHRFHKKFIANNKRHYEWFMLDRYPTILKNC